MGSGRLKRTRLGTGCRTMVNYIYIPRLNMKNHFRIFADSENRWVLILLLLRKN
jgi:hypothetical protein